MNPYQSMNDYYSQPYRNNSSMQFRPNMFMDEQSGRAGFDQQMRDAQKYYEQERMQDATRRVPQSFQPDMMDPFRAPPQPSRDSQRYDDAIRDMQKYYEQERMTPPRRRGMGLLNGLRDDNMYDMSKAAFL